MDAAAGSVDVSATGAVRVRPWAGRVSTNLIVSGFCGAYQVAANAAFVTAAPSRQRGQAFGLANAGTQTGQGLYYVIAGTAAGITGPARVIAASGIIGAVAASLLAARSDRGIPVSAAEAE
jgi:hypothetical protein